LAARLITEGERVANEGNDALVEALRDELRAAGLGRVILLGRLEHMRGPRLKVGLARWGFQVLVPPAAEQAWLEQAIVAAMEEGVPRRADVEHLAALIAEGSEHGVEGLVLACEELSPLVGACGLELPLVEAWMLQGREA